MCQHMLSCGTDKKSNKHFVLFGGPSIYLVFLHFEQ